MLQTTRPKLALIASSLLFTCLISLQANAGWWDDAVSTAKSLGDEEAVEDVMNGSLQDSALSIEDISKAFKEALTIGSEQVVAKLGQKDGFNADPTAHIPLPKKLKKVRKVLKTVGLESYADDLETKLNRAAEAATPVAKQLFIDSISSMSFDDVKKIYEGPEDSATRFFEAKMGPSLSEQMKPIVDSSLLEVGAIKAYDKVINKYEDIPYVPDIKSDLSKHVIKKGMAAIFHYIAEEEAAIRKDPVRQTTDLLQQVFGS